MHSFNLPQTQRGHNNDSIWVAAFYMNDIYTRYYFSKEFQRDSIYPYLINISNRTKGAIIVYTQDVPAYLPDDSVYNASYLNAARVLPVYFAGSAFAMYSVGYIFNIGNAAPQGAPLRASDNMWLSSLLFATCSGAMDTYRIKMWNDDYKIQLRRVCRQRIEVESGQDTSIVVFTKPLNTIARDTTTLDGRTLHIPTRTTPIMDTLYLGIDKLYGNPFTVPVYVEP